MDQAEGEIRNAALLRVGVEDVYRIADDRFDRTSASHHDFGARRPEFCKVDDVLLRLNYRSAPCWRQRCARCGRRSREACRAHLAAKWCSARATESVAAGIRNQFVSESLRRIKNAGEIPFVLCEDGNKDGRSDREFRFEVGSCPP